MSGPTGQAWGQISLCPHGNAHRIQAWGPDIAFSHGNSKKPCRYAKPGRQSEGLDLSFSLWKCPQTETKLWGAMHECPKRPSLGGRSRGPSSQTAKRGGQARGTWHAPRGTASPQLQQCEIITGRYDDILVSSPRPVHGRLGILSSSPGPLKLPYKYRNPPKQKQQP